MQLSAASFISIVGAQAGITDDIARWHEDWGPCEDHHEGVSVLLPLFDTPAGPVAYRLEYRTWDCIDEVKVYDYELGDAIVVDGRAPHRTAPFTAHDLAKVNGERVLVCLNYASTEPSARPAQIQVMESQTPHFYELALVMTSKTKLAHTPLHAACKSRRRCARYSLIRSRRGSSNMPTSPWTASNIPALLLCDQHRAGAGRPIRLHRALPTTARHLYWKTGRKPIVQQPVTVRP